MFRLLSSVHVIILAVSCGEPDPKNNGSNNASSNNASNNASSNNASNNAMTNNTTSNNGTTNASTGTTPNAKPSDCADDEEWVVTCECGPANGCFGEVGRCLQKCNSDDDCPTQLCGENGLCQTICG